MSLRVIGYASIIIALAAAVCADVAYDPDGLVTTRTTVTADSVTVGERFLVTYELTYPDTLQMVPAGELKIDKARVLAFVWNERAEGGTTIRRGDMTAITLDLAGASIPELPFDFVTPAGDTIRAYSRGVDIPVRFMAGDSASAKPLKAQWEAPRNMLAWAAAATGALLLAALVWWLVRRRRKRAIEAPPQPRLPADYVALTELTRIEKLGLLDEEEYKQYYTLVIDAVRRYLEERYGMEAMDRTSVELLDEIGRRGLQIDALGPLTVEADLVKFARYVPTLGDGQTAMHRAREVVVKTAPRRGPAPEGSQQDDELKVAG